MLLPQYYYRTVPPHSGGGGAGAAAGAAMVAVAGEDLVSVHSVLVVGGYIGCGASVVFSVLLVLMSPGPTGEEGALRYISDGMNIHCGYTTVVMGTCSLLVLACQLVAAVHMTSGAALWCALIEAVSWNVVLGVSDTGWKVHYAGLVLFLFSGLCYHWIASRDPGYGGYSGFYAAVAAGATATATTATATTTGGYYYHHHQYSLYARLNTLAWLFTGVFAVLAGTSIGLGDLGGGVLRSFAVAFEFVLLTFMVAQNALLIRALDQFRDIRLRFVRYD
jgi:hypothetical protein